jgi:hypothetical protein
MQTILEMIENQDGEAVVQEQTLTPQLVVRDSA